MIATNKSNGRAKIDIRRKGEDAKSKPQIAPTDNNQFLYNLSELDRLFPNKFLYTVKETADILNVSDDFIFRRIKDGKLKAVRLGDRSMIGKRTLAEIITNGV